MTTAPPVHHSGPDSGIPGHLVNHLPRYHPIAMNPNPPPHQMPPPEQMVQSHHFRHFAPPMHEHHPPAPAVPPAHSPASLEHIEARLRHLEHEEMARNATRSRILAMRKHEDEEFRAMTERAEAEEEVSRVDTRLRCWNSKISFTGPSKTTKEIKERVYGPGTQCRG